MKVRWLLLAVMGVAMAGCTTTSEGTGISPARLNPTTTLAEPAQFVRETRAPQGTDYIPVGVTPPAGNAPKRNVNELKLLEAELDSQRNRSAAHARRAAPKSSYDGKIPPRPAPPPKELLPE